MMELRHNPITDEWIIISSETQKRPVLPQKEACPLCPGILEMKHDYDLTAFDNRYPALRMDPPEIYKPDSVFENARSYGKCEVIMFTSDHNSSLSRMPIGQIEKLIYVWEDRTRDLMKHDEIKYIFPFENRGKEVGASQIHPHGQLYAFPFIPKRIQSMIDAIDKYKGECAICDVMKAEAGTESIVYEGEYFVALVPYFARFPYEVHVYPKRHISFFTDMTPPEKFDLAAALKVVTSKYDSLFHQEFPYMMEIFQSPVNPTMERFHFHIEFNPPKRDKVNVKWMASVETGTWAFINPVTPADAARSLKNASYTI